MKSKNPAIQSTSDNEYTVYNLRHTQSRHTKHKHPDMQFVAGLFDDGWTPSEIAEATRLPITDVKALVAELVLA